MKKIFITSSLIISALVLALMVVSCKKKQDTTEEPTPTPSGHEWSPTPEAGGILPTEVLPAALGDTVAYYFTIYSGENPPAVYGQFVSSPHKLLFSTVANDTVEFYNDRYIAFFRDGEFIDFYGKQLDDDTGTDYEETKRGLYVIGTGENFTCYYLTDGYPNGMYAKQSTIFSGKWNDSYGGLKDFQVAVILLETSGNPNLDPKGSFRVLGDGDGLAETDEWLPRKRANSDVKVTDEDLFRMFRKK